MGTTLVEAWVEKSGLTIKAIAQRAGVATSTVYRIMRGTVDPSVGTLREILIACGSDLRLEASISADPLAAAAARSVLDGHYQPGGLEVAAWQERLARWSGTDPVTMVAEAGKASGVLHRPDLILLAGHATLGRLASAGTTSGKQWAISGVPGLQLPGFDQPVVGPAIFWCESPREIAQLLGGSSLRQTTSLRTALIALVTAENQLFQGSFEHDQILYAAPLQIMLDCFSLGGQAAQHARQEVSTW